MLEPISTGASLGLGYWAWQKSTDAVSNILFDQAWSAILQPKQKALVAHMRETWLGEKDGPATNHDLQRAFAMAICKAADVLLVEIEGATATPEVAAGQHPDIASFVERGRSFISDLRETAEARREPFQEPLGEELLHRAISIVPEVDVDPADRVALTRAIAWALATLIEQHEGEPLPQIAQTYLISPERAERFGSRVMDEFVELLKSGDYPQATIAFDQRMSGEILKELGDVRAELDRITSLTEEQRDGIIACVEMHADGAA